MPSRGSMQASTSLSQPGIGMRDQGAARLLALTCVKAG
jgi:hypothetical protein